MATPMHRKTLKNTGSASKPEFGHSRNREELSQKDRKVLARTLGPFDFDTPLSQLHTKLIQNPRFQKTEPPDPESESIKIVSMSGFTGYLNKTMLQQVCHA